MTLIPRFYDPSHGRVLVDGVENSHYRLRTLREQIAIVQQEVIVRAGSVRDNLRYGQLDASDAAIEHAARLANAHEFIMHLPQGYDTDLAEAGTGLSGGEKQRLSIARAILKDAPIRQRTTFVIAHRRCGLRIGFSSSTAAASSTKVPITRSCARVSSIVNCRHSS